MASSDARGVRHVRCPRCHGVLQEPGAPVYQCGGCGATLRAKNTQGVAAPPASGDVARRSDSLPAPYAGSGEQQATGGAASRLRESGDNVASTSGTPDDVTATSTRRRQETDAASRRGGVVASTSASTPDHVTASSSRRATGTTPSRRPESSSGDLAVSVSTSTQKKEHTYEQRTSRGTDGAERDAISRPAVSANTLSGGTRDATASDAEETKRRKSQAAELPPDAARRKRSGEAAVLQPRFRDRPQQLAPRSPHQAAAGVKVPSPPPRHEPQQAEKEDLAPLRQKILKTVDELKGDLSELFSKSPDLNPATTRRARPPPPPSPRRIPPPNQAETGHYASRGAVAASSVFPARAAAVNHHGNAARVAAAAAPPLPPRRGLPSRRYRRCRAEPPCREAVACHHGRCCRHHGNKPECRGHCGRPSAQERNPTTAAAEQANRERRRRPRPRHHCRPVLKGAPFIICSSCFQLVQVPADFAVSTHSNRLRKLRCGSCSALLSYSYRDPGRKKKPEEEEYSVGRCSTDGHGGGPFAPFVDGFGLSSYSTEDEQPLHVSRNTSFDDAVDGVKGAAGRLHRLMGYGSASELLLLRHSPDLYERSFDQRTTTPDYDRKGKSVCIDAEDEDDLDDSDDDDGGVPARSAARGAVWPLPGMLGKGVPGPGAIRIKS